MRIFLKITILSWAPLLVATLQVENKKTEPSHMDASDESVNVWPFDDDTATTATAPPSTRLTTTITTTTTTTTTSTITTTSTTFDEALDALAAAFSNVSTSTTSTVPNTTDDVNSSSGASNETDLENQTQNSNDEPNTTGAGNSSSEASHETHLDNQTSNSDPRWPVGNLGPGDRWEYHHSDEKTSKQSKASHEEHSQATQKEKNTHTITHTQGNVKSVQHIDISNGSHGHDSNDDFGIPDASDFNFGFGYSHHLNFIRRTKEETSHLEAVVQENGLLRLRDLGSDADEVHVEINARGDAAREPWER